MRDDLKKNPILLLTFRFSIGIMEYAEILESRKKYALSQQLFRSGTAVGAMVREAQNSESKNDFIHKFKIAAKEADEIEYWLELCMEKYGDPQAKELMTQIQPICRIINSIIATSKNKLKSHLNQGII